MEDQRILLNDLAVHGNDSLVTTTALSKTFDGLDGPVWAVHDVHIEILTGQFVALVGASGSGKSTLVSLLAGLESPSEGRVQILGRDLQELAESERTAIRRRSIGVVFQANNLINELTALENVALPLEADGVSTGSAMDLARRSLERVHMADLAHRYPYQLSGGQQQRVGIARSIVGKRSLLLADEPTGALDSSNTDELFRLIREMCDSGLGALVATHDSLVSSYADRILQISDGRVVELPKLVN